MVGAARGIAPDFDPDDERRLYPTEYLVGAEVGLLLFAAGLKGRNDGYWFLEAGIPWVTAVDLIEERVEAMKPLYPEWEFVVADAFEFARATPEQSYDVVSVDSHTGLSARTLAEASLWMRLSRNIVTIGTQWLALGAVDRRLDIEEVAAILNIQDTDFAVIDLYERNQRSLWIVLQRCS